MLITSEVNFAAAAHLGEANLAALLGVQFDEQHSVIFCTRHKGQVMFFGHFMGKGNVVIVLYFLHMYTVGPLDRLLGQGLQLPTTAGDLRFTGGGENISAVGTNIKFQFFHVSSVDIVGRKIARQNFFNVDAQHSGQIP